MPLAAMAFAVSRISCAETLHPKWFQLFQPIGGVRARPLSSGAVEGTALAPKTSRASSRRRGWTISARGLRLVEGVVGRAEERGGRVALVGEHGHAHTDGDRGLLAVVGQALDDPLRHLPRGLRPGLRKDQREL